MLSEVSKHVCKYNRANRTTEKEMVLSPDDDLYELLSYEKGE